ncbi:MAG: hypothetical protein ABI706_07065 [Ilumatobacteraceae bacterium]
MDERIEARIAGLEAEIANLKAMVTSDSRTEIELGPPTSDRRGMVKLLAASAVGAVAGAAIFNAEPAAAIQGGGAMLGMPNDSANTTGFTASNDVGVTAFGSPTGISSDGASGNALFPGSGPAPTSNFGLVGMLYVDAAGDWWASTADGAQGLWRKLAGPSTAGQLHILPAPIRVYDSRLGEAPAAVGPKAPSVSNAVRIIDTTGNGSNVPVDANAVLINLTVTGPQTAGFASAWATGAFPGTSSINFAAGQSIAGTTVVGCGPSATIQILSNTVTDFLVDVIGFYQ